MGDSREFGENNDEVTDGEPREMEVDESGEENSESESEDSESGESGEEYSDWESGSDVEGESPEAEDTSNHYLPTISGEQEESSDEETQKCPICLCRLNDQDVGTPESCDHNFCLECIEEWSKNVNTCPVDRQVFNLILAKHALEGVVFKKIPVVDKNLRLEEVVEEDNTYCEVCGQADREDRLLLCDGCDLGYHCECLTPALRSIPSGEWFCPDCSIVNRNAASTSRGRNAISRRQIARTIVSERVRNAVMVSRVQRGRLMSGGEDEEFMYEVVDSHHASTTRRPAPRRKRKTGRKKKRRSKKRKTTKKSTTTSKTRKRKHKGRRGAARTKRATPKTTKVRLAGKLGISTPRVGCSLPTVRGTQAERNMDTQRGDTGIAPLSILGDRNMLDPCFESDDEFVDTGSGGVATVSVSRHIGRYSTAALKSVQVLKAPPRSVNRQHIPHIEKPPCSGLDILGDLLKDQSNLLSNSETVTIRRDGSLQHKGSKANLKKGYKVRSCTTTSPDKEGSNSSHQSSSKDSEGSNESSSTSQVSGEDSTQQQARGSSSTGGDDGGGDESGEQTGGEAVGTGCGADTEEDPKKKPEDKVIVIMPLEDEYDPAEPTDETGSQECAEPTYDPAEPTSEPSPGTPTLDDPGTPQPEEIEQGREEQTSEAEEGGEEGAEESGIVQEEEGHADSDDELITLDDYTAQAAPVYNDDDVIIIEPEEFRSSSSSSRKRRRRRNVMEEEEGEIKSRSDEERRDHRRSNRRRRRSKENYPEPETIQLSSESEDGSSHSDARSSKRRRRKRDSGRSDRRHESEDVSHKSKKRSRKRSKSNSPERLQRNRHRSRSKERNKKDRRHDVDPRGKRSRSREKRHNSRERRRRSRSRNRHRDNSPPPRDSHRQRSRSPHETLRSHDTRHSKSSRTKHRSPSVEKHRSRSQDKSREKQRSGRSGSYERRKVVRERSMSQEKEKSLEITIRRRRKESAGETHYRHRSRSRSPKAHRSRKHPSVEREVREKRRSDDYRGTVKMFSQSLKEVCEAESNSRRSRGSRGVYSSRQESNSRPSHRQSISPFSDEEEEPRPPVRTSHKKASKVVIPMKHAKVIPPSVANFNDEGTPPVSPEPVRRRKKKRRSPEPVQPSPEPEKEEEVDSESSESSSSSASSGQLAPTDDEDGLKLSTPGTPDLEAETDFQLEKEELEEQTESNEKQSDANMESIPAPEKVEQTKPSKKRPALDMFSTEGDAPVPALGMEPTVPPGHHLGLPFAIPPPNIVQTTPPPPLAPRFGSPNFNKAQSTSVSLPSRSGVVAQNGEAELRPAVSVAEVRPTLVRVMQPPPPPPTGLAIAGSSQPTMPEKAIDEIQQISSLLNVQKKMGIHEQKAEGTSTSNVFKVPSAPPPGILKKDKHMSNEVNNRSGVTILNAPLSQGVIDMDVASPTSDDECMISFSPPPQSKQAGGKRHKHRRSGKAGAHASKETTKMNDEDIVRTIQELTKEDEPVSAVELDKKEKFLKKLNRQERVVEEVKLAIKPHFAKKKIDKGEYKDILRKAVPKICHSKSGDINPEKIRGLVAAYVEKARKMRKYVAAKEPPSKDKKTHAKRSKQS